MAGRAHTSLQHSPHMSGRETSHLHSRKYSSEYIIYKSLYYVMYKNISRSTTRSHHAPCHLFLISQPFCHTNAYIILSHHSLLLKLDISSVTAPSLHSFRNHLLEYLSTYYICSLFLLVLAVRFWSHPLLFIELYSCHC